MASSINRLVASRVFLNHQVTKGVFVTVELLRVANKFDSRKENGIVTATKLVTTKKFFVAATKTILLQQPNVLLIELNILWL